MKRYIRAAVEMLPFDLQDWITFGENLATDMKLPKGYGVTMRKKFVEDAYHAFMRCTGPQGFHPNWANIEFSNVGARFNAQEIKVADYCPNIWQRELRYKMLDAFEYYEPKYIKMLHK